MNIGIKKGHFIKVRIQGIAFLLFIIVQLSFAQKNNFIIHLDETLSFNSISKFKCVEILNPKGISKLGVVAVGLAGNKVPVYFEREFYGELSRHIGITDKLDSQDIPISIIVHKLKISEDKSPNMQFSSCEIELEFARKENGKYYSLAIIKKETNSYTQTGIKNSHDDNITSAIYQCAKVFFYTVSIHDKGVPIQEQNFDIVFRPEKEIINGAYRSFAEITRFFNPKSLNFNLYLEKFKKGPNNYRLNDEKGIFFGYDFLFQDTAVYYRVGASRFLKSSLFGKYIYFEGVITPSKYKAMPGFAVATSKKSYILNTDNREFKELNEYNFFQIARKYPDVVAHYRNSKRGASDMKYAIALLNEKFK